MIVRRDDDTCGWFTPPYSPSKKDEILQLAAGQYSTIFARQWAVAEGKDYARVCYAPNCYDAIYWAWRAIKHHETKRGVWQYDPALTTAERRYIYELDSNPVDNLRSLFEEVKDAETFASFFLTVFHCYLRFNRPWYKHPRWHIWHWRFQVHPWQLFRRWLLTRCEGCGKRFAYGYSPVSHSWDSKRPKFLRGERGLYHSECSHMTTKLEREPSQGTA